MNLRELLAWVLQRASLYAIVLHADDLPMLRARASTMGYVLIEPSPLIARKLAVCYTTDPPAGWPCVALARHAARAHVLDWLAPGMHRGVEVSPFWVRMGDRRGIRPGAFTSLGVSSDQCESEVSR